MIQIIQKQEVKTKALKFPPINVVYGWCTQAVWWGCIAPYSHCVSAGRGGGRGREKWENLPKLLCVWFWFILRKKHGGEPWTNLTCACCSRRFCTRYSPKTYGWNIMYSHNQIRRLLQTPSSGCVWGIFAGCWYLHPDSSPGMMAHLPHGLSQEVVDLDS